MPTKDVYPTGNPLEDADRIQAAVNDPQWDEIRLMGREEGPSGRPQFFNLMGGSAGRKWVSLTRDVRIVGELTPLAYFLRPPASPGQAGYAPVIVGHQVQAPLALTVDRTVVYGGVKVFRTDQTKVNVSVENLYFAYPEWSAVQVTRTTGVEISHCVVHGVTLGTSTPGGRVLKGAFGFEITALATGATALTGSLKINDNVLFRDPVDVEQDFAEGDVGCGITVQLAKMNLDICRNDIKNFSLAGIGIDRHELGEAKIYGNNVYNCGHLRGTTTVMQYGSGIGILRTNARVPQNRTVLIGQNQDPKTSPNQVWCGHPNPGFPSAVTKYGIVLAGCDGVDVTNNDIHGNAQVAVACWDDLAFGTPGQTGYVAQGTNNFTGNNCS